MMELIKLYRSNPLSAVRYIGGNSKRYNCITLWNDADGLTQTYTPYLKHVYENRVRKGINPFN